MLSIDVRAAQHSYRVLIGQGLLADAGAAIKRTLPPNRCAVISDTNVAPHFGDPVQRSLTAAGYDAKLITVPAGEGSKNLGQAGQICEQMLTMGLDRQSFVIGLGGGVIGDLSGFVAAIFERGIPHVQVPTTLLAMVDSSIGGKTGVNSKAGKNLIGAFHSPTLVIDDVDVLNTLPRRELNQGFAEIIKHAVIADPEMFGQLENINFDNVDFAPLVWRNAGIKARIVERDERERTGERALLNFGHTVGHAIEIAAGYRGILHGEAVSLGMVAACEISMIKAGLLKKERDRVVDLLGKSGLPTRLPKDFPRAEIFEALKFDKKFSRGQVRFVVTSKIGSGKLSNDVMLEDIRAAVETL